MELKKYIAPRVEVYEFKNEDILCTSAVFIDDKFLKGNNAINIGTVDASSGFFK